MGGSMSKSSDIERIAMKSERKTARWGIEKRIEYWRSEEGCTLISGWTREGYRPADIAARIGISPGTFIKWMERYEEIDKAVREGSELNDYRVENALLKNALGYTARNVTVTTIIRHGKVVETQRVVEEQDVAPNVNAQKVWLYNRRPKQWIPESKLGGEVDEDSSLSVEILRMEPGDDNEEFRARSAAERSQLLDELSEEDRQPAQGAAEVTDGPMYVVEDIAGDSQRSDRAEDDFDDSDEWDEIDLEGWDED